MRTPKTHGEVSWEAGWPETIQNTRRYVGVQLQRQLGPLKVCEQWHTSNWTETPNPLPTKDWEELARR